MLVCGVFGNISDNDIERTIAYLPTLCAPGAWVIWTRYPGGDGFVHIPTWLEAAGFQVEELVVRKADSFSVGAARLQAPAKPFRPGDQLFTFDR